MRRSLNCCRMATAVLVLGSSALTASPGAGAARVCGAVAIPSRAVATLKSGETSGGGASGSQEDPHSIYTRFVQTHAEHFDSALMELKAGKKRGHWSWFIFPSGPYVVGGVERGSETNRFFALRTPAAARAFLAFPKTNDKKVDLRRNLIQTFDAVSEQCERGKSLAALVGRIDEPKVLSCLALFTQIAEEDGDAELLETCKRCKNAVVETTASGWRSFL